MDALSVADIEGAWLDQEIESSLIQRCRDNWTIPVHRLSNLLLSTFIRQRIALTLVLPEARRRIEFGISDDSELYDEELLNSVKELPLESDPGRARRQTR